MEWSPDDGLVLIYKSIKTLIAQTGTVPISVMANSFCQALSRPSQELLDTVL